MSVQSIDKDDRGGARLRIGELSRRTGVSADTLRAWERRYDLLVPARSEGGYRLYSETDEARVRAMKALMDSGYSAAEAAREAREPAAPAAGAGEGSAAIAGRLREALERFDDAAANAALDEAVASLSVDALAADIALPVLGEIGERWQRGEVSVAQEHFASNLLRGRLLGLARGWGTGAGPLALLACPPGELHDVGLISFGLALRARGWRITYLGPDTPVETIADAADRLDPGLVVIAALEPSRFRHAGDAIARLADEREVLLAGAGADAALAERLGAGILGEGPVEAATAIAARSPG